MKSINIIGAGKLGKTIGYLWKKHQLGPIIGVLNRSEQSVHAALQAIGEGAAYCNLKEMPHADITFITTPDASIQNVCELLSKNSSLKAGDLVVHCSGVLSSDVLASAKTKGCWIASIHPMRSFAVFPTSAENYAGTYCAVEGEKEALERIEPLFKAMGFIIFTIHKDKKSLYHASAVFASNYLVTLMNESLKYLQQADVTEALAKDIIFSIMKQTINNLEHQNPQQALTGPIQRCDIQTIQHHLNGLKEQSTLYKALGLATLSLTQHDPIKLELLQKLFSKEF